jgi:hypothetical protein
LLNTWTSTTPWELRGRVDAQTQLFLNQALIGSERSASRLVRLTQTESASKSQWIGVWLGPIFGPNEAEEREFLTTWDSNSAPRSSLCRLRYTAPTALTAEYVIFMYANRSWRRAHMYTLTRTKKQNRYRRRELKIKAGDIAKNTFSCKAWHNICKFIKMSR